MPPSPPRQEKPEHRAILDVQLPKLWPMVRALFETSGNTLEFVEEGTSEDGRGGERLA